MLNMSSAWNVAKSLTPKSFAIWRLRKPSSLKKQKQIPDDLRISIKTVYF